MKKKSKFKENLKKFKELWAIPRYRALIKLSLYGIMFLMLIIMANMYQDTTSNKNNKTEQTKTYTDIINSINLEKGNIVYIIKTLSTKYKIEGKIENNVLSGYLENDIIKKIIVKDNNIYQINNDNEILDEELNNLIVAHFLLPTNIIELVKEESAYINKGIEDTTYEFNINYNNINYEIKIIINAETITNINIKNDQIDYNMQIDFDKIA